MQAALLTLIGPICALPIFFTAALFGTIDHPPGILDPLREQLGPLTYNLRWSARAAPFMAILYSSGLAESFYLSLPILLTGNYALTRLAESIRSRLLSYGVLFAGAGAWFAAATYLGLWLGLWAEPHWT